MSLASNPPSYLISRGSNLVLHSTIENIKFTNPALKASSMVFADFASSYVEQVVANIAAAKQEADHPTKLPPPEEDRPILLPKPYKPFDPKKDITLLPKPYDPNNNNNFFSLKGKTKKSKPRSFRPDKELLSQLNEIGTPEDFYHLNEAVYKALKKLHNI